MNQSTSLITSNQRIIDQLALENLNGLRVKRELAIQEKSDSDKDLVLYYLRRKFPHVELDSCLAATSVINSMAKDEFDRVLKRAKIRHFSILGLKITLPLLLLFSIFLRAYLNSGLKVAIVVLGSSVIILSIIYAAISHILRGTAD